MIYKLLPRRLCLIVDADRFANWRGDKRADLRLLNLAIQFTERFNADAYRGYQPGELRCVGFDSTKSGQTIIEFEETFALPKPRCDDSVLFSQLPPGRWQEIHVVQGDVFNYEY